MEPAFRKFSLQTALRTGLPSLRYYLTRPALPASDRLPLFTMNILPPMGRVWYHFARKHLGDQVDITIFDCSGRLNPAHFPGATVQPFINLYASAKSDEFLYHIARNRTHGWICDDDVFFVSGESLKVLEREFAVPNTATVSLRARKWWEFDIDGQPHPVSGSYSIAFDRQIFCDKEKLSLAPADGNTHNRSLNGKPLTRYDTGDLSNELLLRRGYRCYVSPDDESKRCLASFSGLSGAVILLWLYKTPEEVLAYLTDPPKEAWGGTMLFGILSAMLAIWTIQDLHAEIFGAPYHLPTLPPREKLQALAAEVTPFLPKELSFQWVEDVRQQLFAAL
ncbi:MAG: hypothetical protein KBC95_03905 [Candidatus Peribacteraceae bacterium]|nr:hypothetical protein [Candidatus Peribacteraceae bacterium]